MQSNSINCLKTGALIDPRPLFIMNFIKSSSLNSKYICLDEHQKMETVVRVVTITVNKKITSVAPQTD
jgi:hypothetical protein